MTDFGELCVLTPSMLKTQHVVRVGVRPCFCLSSRSAAGTLCWHTATGMLCLVSELWFKTESSPSYESRNTFDFYLLQNFVIAPRGGRKSPLLFRPAGLDLPTH